MSLTSNAGVTCPEGRMQVHVNNFRELSLDELYGLLQLRAEVFVVEQNCPYQDVDGIDKEAVQVYGTMDGEIVACLRVYLWPDGNAAIGRVVNSKKVRGTGVGKQLMLEGIKVARELYPGRRCLIHSQCYAIPFYEKCGFTVAPEFEPFLEDGIPHRMMELYL